MNAFAVNRDDARATAAPEPGRSAAAPIYVVCSPNRQVGKTMVARLLAEHYAADARPFAAFDLSDEAPGLADFLARPVTIASIRDVRSQMRFFDGLIECGNVAKIIDLSRHEFANFFTIADKIGLFEEARRRAIEPVILFRSIRPRSPRRLMAYCAAVLRRTSLLPVRNLMVAKGLPYGASFPNASRVSLEIAVLGPAARALAAREEFSFLNLSKQGWHFEMSARTGAELEAWFRRARFQFREIELSLMRKQILTALRADLLA